MRRRTTKSARRPKTYHHGALPAALMEVAKELIAERGLDGFTLREVARRVGVTHVAAYRHYADRRALLAAVAVGAMALVSFVLSGTGAPSIRRGLARQWWSWPFQAVTGLVAVGAIAALWARRFALARGLAMAQVTLILWGWGLAQFPFLIEPDLTFASAAAPGSVLRPLLVALAAGVVVLGPALVYLFRVFKTSPGTRPHA